MASRISSKSILLSRNVIRLGIRFESSTAQTSKNQIQNLASDAASKASLIAQRTSHMVSQYVIKMGPSFGPQFSRIQSLQTPLVYYSKVFAEIAKYVYKMEKLSPPNLVDFQNAYKEILNFISSRSKVLEILKDKTSLGKLGVISLELIGFFSVGEMLGRWHIVGYNLPPQNHH